MNNLEFLCGALRGIGRPDAAQILEGYTCEEWDSIGRDLGGPLEPAEGEGLHHAQSLLNRLFWWGCTLEGHEFWDCVDKALSRRGDS